MTGDLTLTDGAEVIKRTAFSEGNSFNPLDDGKYGLRLDIRGDEDTDEANTDGTLKPYYGIQKVGTYAEIGKAAQRSARAKGQSFGTMTLDRRC